MYLATNRIKIKDYRSGNKMVIHNIKRYVKGCNAQKNDL